MYSTRAMCFEQAQLASAQGNMGWQWISSSINIEHVNAIMFHISRLLAGQSKRKRNLIRKRPRRIRRRKTTQTKPWNRAKNAACMGENLEELLQRRSCVLADFRGWRNAARGRRRTAGLSEAPRSLGSRATLRSSAIRERSGRLGRKPLFNSLRLFPHMQTVLK